jgi:hypothetical protein
VPGLAQDLVDAMGTPDADQAADAAAADVDQVLREQVLAGLARCALAPEQRQVRRLAARRREVPVEADDVVVGVAARAWQEAHPRALAPGELEHELVQEWVAGLHREAPAAEGDDLSQSVHAALLDRMTLVAECARAATPRLCPGVEMWAARTGQPVDSPSSPVLMPLFEPA